MNFEEVGQDTVDLLKERIVTQHLDGVRWKVKHYAKLKNQNGIPCKAEFPKKSIAEVCGFDVLFIINEDIFDGLTEEYQKIAIDKLLAYVHFDMQKDVVKNSTPDVKEHSGILMRYDYTNKILPLQSEVERLYREKEEEGSQD